MTLSRIKPKTWALIAGAVGLVYLVKKKATDSLGISPLTPVASGAGYLTSQQVYGLCRDAGFPPEVARRMVAIAMRESALKPSALCDGCVPGVAEYSIGLFQINMLGDLGARRLIQFGIQNREQLFDPAINARAAYLTWGGQERNLNIAWSIERDSPLPYKTRYLQNLAKLPPVGTMEVAYQNGNL